MRRLRATGWLALVALITLAARTLVYALAPASPLATHLGGELGGPRPVIVVLVAALAAIAMSVGVLWLASIGARERWALSEPSLRGDAPRIDLRPVAVRAGGLWLATMVLFAAVESWLHLRAGLGLHGLTCLVGPVHRCVIPVAAALALVAAASVTAGQHLLRWMRRVVARVLAGRPRRRRRIVAVLCPAAAAPPPRGPVLRAVGPRPPPCLSGSTY